MSAEIMRLTADLESARAEIARLQSQNDAAFELWCAADSTGRLADEMAMRLRGVGKESVKENALAVDLAETQRVTYTRDGKAVAK